MADKMNMLQLFLEGIEDFEEIRAAECLKQLLDARYDTIRVLKLATKQDLIDDAGIKPGDSLRIISAAREAVAHCNEPAPSVALPSNHESPKPPAKRKRVKTIARATRKMEDAVMYQRNYQGCIWRWSKYGLEMKTIVKPHMFGAVFPWFLPLARWISGITSMGGDIFSIATIPNQLQGAKFSVEIDDDCTG